MGAAKVTFSPADKAMLICRRLGAVANEICAVAESLGELTVERVLRVELSAIAAALQRLRPAVIVRAAE